jgi:sulfate adenylyltransferase
MMKKATEVEPHGGSLVNLMVDEERAAVLKKIAMNLSDITLTNRQLCDLELLATGAFSPLDGFMTRPDYESVLDRMRLQSNVLWPIPVCLGISDIQAKTLEAGQSVTLRDQEGFMLAIMHIEDIWPVDREKEASLVYGTTDSNHQGVEYLFNTEGDHYLGGKIEVLSLPLHFDFKQLRMTPLEIRNIYRKLGWHRVVGFQTRNPIQRPQFEMTVAAMRQARANLLLLPITGMTKPGDFDHYTRVRCYRAVTCHYPPDSFILNLLPLSMRLSGPRIPFEELVYLPFEDEYRSQDQVPEGTQYISFSSSDIRERIRTGRRIPEWATFPEVEAELKKAYPSPDKQGFTVFLTGLPGAGKSTIAKVLYARFLEMGDRPVTLLDGDIVRQNLSSQLSFSKEDRDINVRRIGFVASEITKNRGIAICAPIAPYDATRTEIRKNIETYGGFIEVHVSTPIKVCEKRDRKGMYAKARAGMIKGFTGVDDPYELPESPEVRIDTTDLNPDEAVQEILLLLGQKGYI